METLTLKIKDINVLNEIRNTLYNSHPLTLEQTKSLCSFLSGIPPTKKLLAEKVHMNSAFEIIIYNSEEIKPHLKKWGKALKNLPGNDIYPRVNIINNEMTLARKGVIIKYLFEPSLFFNQAHKIFEVHFKIDSTATFYLPTLEDAEKFPQLYSFNGSWKEAYILIIKTMFNGWPQDKFPPEFEKLLVQTN